MPEVKFLEPLRKNTSQLPEWSFRETMVEKINEICAFVNNCKAQIEDEKAKKDIIKEPPMPNPAETNQPPDVDLTNEIHKGGKIE